MADGGNRVLVIGYGNPGRQDDGLGPAAVEAVAAWSIKGLDTDASYQLNIEDGALLAEYDKVLFIDASTAAPAPFECYPLEASDEIQFTTHALSAESVLAIARDHFDARTEVWMMGIRGYSFAFEEEMTPQAQENLTAALAYIQEKLHAWKEERS